MSRIGKSTKTESGLVVAMEGGERVIAKEWDFFLFFF